MSSCEVLSREGGEGDGDEEGMYVSANDGHCHGMVTDQRPPQKRGVKIENWDQRNGKRLRLDATTISRHGPRRLGTLHVMGCRG